jgi:hypothetical protein
MYKRRIAFCAIECFGSLLLGITGALAQASQTNVPTAAIPRIALKSGESWELGIAAYTSNCRSIVIGKPQIEVLEGPPEVTVTIKEGDVIPRAQGCTNKVPGGTIVATAGNITETKLSRLIARVKYKTKDGDRQVAVAYYIGLVP